MLQLLSWFIKEMLKMTALLMSCDCNLVSLVRLDRYLTSLMCYDYSILLYWYAATDIVLYWPAANGTLLYCCTATDTMHYFCILANFTSHFLFTMLYFLIFCVQYYNIGVK